MSDHENAIKLIKDLGLTAKIIGEIIGKSQSVVYDKLKQYRSNKFIKEDFIKLLDYSKAQVLKNSNTIEGLSINVDKEYNIEIGREKIMQELENLVKLPIEEVYLIALKSNTEEWGASQKLFEANEEYFKKLIISKL